MTRHRQPWIAVTALTIVSWPVSAGPPARDPSDPTSAVLTTAEDKVVPEEYEYVWSQAAELIAGTHLDDAAAAHLAEALSTLDEALKAPLVRSAA